MNTEQRGLAIETVDQLSQRAVKTGMVEISPDDRREFARALVLQGYDAALAHRMAYDESGDVQNDDGALQMLARHRIAASASKEILELGERFLDACFSAWSCGEPEHRVRAMLDRADKFRAALNTLKSEG